MLILNILSKNLRCITAFVKIIFVSFPHTKKIYIQQKKKRITVVVK